MADRAFVARKGLAVNSIVANVTVHIAANDAILIPRGNTAQRPASPASGYLRFNTETGLYEGYNNSTWASFQDSGAQLRVYYANNVQAFP